jgi:hypothetical protein
MACFATEIPRDLGDCEADDAAPETPSGASLPPLIERSWIAAVRALGPRNP